MSGESAHTVAAKRDLDNTADWGDGKALRPGSRKSRREGKEDEKSGIILFFLEFVFFYQVVAWCYALLIDTRLCRIAFLAFTRDISQYLAFHPPLESRFLLVDPGSVAQDNQFCFMDKAFLHAGKQDSR